MEALKEKIEELLKYVFELLAKITDLTAQLEASNKRYEEVVAKLALSDAQHAEDIAKIEALTKLVEEKSAKKVRKDSHNSSIPPSKEGYSKPAPKTLREKSGKKPGGQEGHTGHGMKIMRDPDVENEYLPELCKGCPNAGKCKFQCAGTHYISDIEFKAVVVAHKVMACECPMRNNEKITGAFPDEAQASKQYGKNLQAFIGALSTAGYVSVGRIAKLINGLGISISVGTVQNIIDGLTKKVEPAVDYIREKIASFDVLNCDETGMRVNGILNWLHCICTPKWSYMAFHSKRGSEAMNEIGIIPGLDDCTLIHDFWRSYLNYTNVRHAFCNAHIERELVYAYETTGQGWALKLKELLSKMCGRRNALMDAGGTAYPVAELRGYQEEYDILVNTAIEANPIPKREPGKRGKAPCGKTRCLAERLRDYKDELLRFATDWAIPFTNNEAEKTIRFSKVKEKVSGGFRTKSGADAFAKIMSYVSTANKHGMFAYEALMEILNGRGLSLVQSWD